MTRLTSYATLCLTAALFAPRLLAQSSSQPASSPTPPRPCPIVPNPPIVAGPDMSQYSADRENAMAPANALFACRDYAGAFALYLKVVDQYPNDARVLMLAGGDAINAGLTEQAIPLLERSLAHSPPKYTGSSRTLLMRAYIKLNRWQDLEAERFDAWNASLAGDTTLPPDKGYAIEEFKTLSGEFVNSIEFPMLHGPNETREQFILIGEKDHCTGFTPHIDLESPGLDHTFSLYAYPAADSRTRLDSYPAGEPTYQTIRADVLAALSSGPLAPYNQEETCTTGPMAGGQLPPVAFHLQRLATRPPININIVGLLLDGQPIAFDTPVRVSGMWMRNVTLVLQNSSPKDLIKVTVTLVFTDTGTGQTGSPYTVLATSAGVFPKNAFLQRDGTNRQVPASAQGPPIDIAPGSNLELAMDPGADSTQSAAYARAPISNVELDIGTVFFSDGSKWVSGQYYVPAPLPQVWKQVSAQEFSHPNP
jgi:hypothetical protein